MTPNSRDKGSLELRGLVWRRGRSSSLMTRFCTTTEMASQRLPTSPAPLAPPLAGSVQPSARLCLLLRKVLWRRSCCIQASPSLRPFLPLHLYMLASAVVSCLPKEGRGLHFPDCLAPFHSCIVICYPRSKPMPADRKSVV